MGVNAFPAELADLSDAKFELVNMLEGLIFDSSPFCGTSVGFTQQDEKQERARVCSCRLTSCLQSPGPTLCHPSGSAGCVVSLLSRFVCPGRILKPCMSFSTRLWVCVFSQLQGSCTQGKNTRCSSCRFHTKNNTNASLC